MDKNEKIKFKAIAEAIVIQIHYQGIIPNYSAYHEEYEEKQKEINLDVENIMDNFEILYKEGLENEESD